MQRETETGKWIKRNNVYSYRFWDLFLPNAILGKMKGEWWRPGERDDFNSPKECRFRVVMWRRWAVVQKGSRIFDYLCQRVLLCYGKAMGCYAVPYFTLSWIHYFGWSGYQYFSSYGEKNTATLFQVWRREPWSLGITLRNFRIIFWNKIDDFFPSRVYKNLHQNNHHGSKKMWNTM